jgi:ethanolamine ammonia-lyase small subunit
VIEDPWSKLREKTAARVALGRAGGSLPTAAVLGFAGDHAAARDAVYSQLDVAALRSAALPLGLASVVLHSRAESREQYLQRPDLGRRLDAASASALQSQAAGEVDVALIVGDGLSALAAQLHAVSVLKHLLPALRNRGFLTSPICIVLQSRVAIQDEIGELLCAKLAVMLIGERPGLGTADSLGAYMVYQPAIGKTDADRNCVSNIRPGQLHPQAAADTLAWLIEQSLRRRLSGVQLKDDRTPALESQQRHLQ